jgi:DNA repair protein RadC
MSATGEGETAVSEVLSTSPAGAAGRRLLDLPREERPRERLARLGAEALSSRELVSVLLGTGARGASALDLADQLLDSGLHALASRSLHELEGARGLGRAKASRLLAALELGARVASDPGGGAPALDSPQAAGRYLLPRYAARPVETFGLLALDARHRLRREAVVSVGCLTASLVHPREVFQEAVVSRAAALVLFHNHPSGDPEPSAEDLSLTRRLAAAGTLMGIEVLDHLVLGAGRYVSLKDRGIL